MKVVHEAEPLHRNYSRAWDMDQDTTASEAADAGNQGDTRKGGKERGTARVKRSCRFGKLVLAEPDAGVLGDTDNVEERGNEAVDFEELHRALLGLPGGNPIEQGTRSGEIDANQ